MRIFKRIAIVIILALFSVSSLTACGGDEPKVNSTQKKVWVNSCSYVGQVLGPYALLRTAGAHLWLADNDRRGYYNNIGYWVPSLEYYDGYLNNISSRFRWTLLCLNSGSGPSIFKMCNVGTGWCFAAKAGVNIPLLEVSSSSNVRTMLLDCSSYSCKPVYYDSPDPSQNQYILTDYCVGTPPNNYCLFVRSQSTSEDYFMYGF